jgi:hypothetical protein
MSYKDRLAMHNGVLALQWDEKYIVDIYTIDASSGAATYQSSISESATQVYFYDNNTLIISYVPYLTDYYCIGIFNYTDSSSYNFYTENDICFSDPYSNNFGNSMAVDGDILLVEYMITTYYNAYGFDVDDYDDFNDIAVREYSISGIDSSTATSNSSGGSSSVVGAVTGGVIGGLCRLACLTYLYYIKYRKRNTIVMDNTVFQSGNKHIEKKNLCRVSDESPADDIIGNPPSKSEIVSIPVENISQEENNIVAVSP